MAKIVHIQWQNFIQVTNIFGKPVQYATDRVDIEKSDFSIDHIVEHFLMQYFRCHQTETVEK
jgi:hypothetical protein